MWAYRHLPVMDILATVSDVERERFDDLFVDILIYKCSSLVSIKVAGITIVSLQPVEHPVSSCWLQCSRMNVWIMVCKIIHIEFVSTLEIAPRSSLNHLTVHPSCIDICNWPMKYNMNYALSCLSYRTFSIVLNCYWGNQLNSSLWHWIKFVTINKWSV